MSFTVEYRLRDWSDWSTEAQHLPIDQEIAHSSPINDLFPDPEHGLSYAPPQLAPASPTQSSPRHPTGDKKNVASPPKPFAHLFWGSPGTKAQPPMQDPLLHNYPLDLPRDVVSAYAHVMSQPTTLSPSVFRARPSPRAQPHAARAAPLAPATNWPSPDPWQQAQPQYHVRGPYSQAPFLKYHFPNAAEAPPPPPPAAIEPPPPPARYYTEYVNNINEPRKLIAAAPEPPAPSPPAKHAKAAKADPWTVSGKASKSSPFPAAGPADHWQNPASAAPWASSAPARKENLWAAPAAVSTNTGAFWQANTDTGKSDKMSGWGPPPKASPPAPAFWSATPAAKTDQDHFWSTAPPVATKAQTKAEKEKARRAHADAVDQMDRSDPNGRAFHHGGPYDPLRAPYERHTHGRTASQGSAGVRFDAGLAALPTQRQRPPSPTAQLDTFVAQVSGARQPASFADLYERTASPPAVKGQKKKEQNQGKGKKGDSGMFGAPMFPASRFEQGAVSAAARHRARVEDEDDPDMPALVPSPPQTTSYWSGGSDMSHSTVHGHGFGQPQGKKGKYPGFR